MNQDQYQPFSEAELREITRISEIVAGTVQSGIDKSATLERIATSLEKIASSLERIAVLYGVRAD